MLKRLLIAPFVAALLLSLPILTRAQTGSVGIGTTTPDASAALEVRSTSQGLLPPRMTLAQRNAIVSPASGLVVYQSDSSPGLYYNAGSATSPYWQALAVQQPTYGTFPATSNSNLPNTRGGASLPINASSGNSGVLYNAPSNSFYVTIPGIYRVAYNLTLTCPTQSSLHVQFLRNGVLAQFGRDNQYSNASNLSSGTTYMVDEAFVLLNAGDQIGVLLRRDDTSSTGTFILNGIVSAFLVK